MMMSLGKQQQRQASSKMFGRNEEVEALLQAYQRSKNCKNDTTSNNNVTMIEPTAAENNNNHKGALPELVLIRGKSGCGKTALALSLAHHVQQDYGFFVSGKFDLISTQQDPYAVFVEAFTQLADYLLVLSENNDRQIPMIRNAVEQAIGKEGKLLCNIIPALDILFSPEQDEEDINAITIKQKGRHEAIHQFQRLFCKLCVAISTVAPLVLFLDDLQWSDPASLQLLLALLKFQASLGQNNSDTSSLLVIGAYREEGIEEDHVDFNNSNENKTSASGQVPFQNYLNQFHQLASSAQLNLTKLHLQSLDESSINEIVADFLHTDISSCQQQSHSIFGSCQGNPFHAFQILNSHYTKSASNSIINKEIIIDGEALETMDELLRRKVHALPELSQKVLQIAAYMGDEIDESAVSTVLGVSITDVERCVQQGYAEGHLFFDEQCGRYRFVHDRIRQAAMLLPTDDSSNDHNNNNNNIAYQIGYSLWTRSYTDKVFLVANLLNTGTMLMTDPTERYRAAALNLEAGITAASLVAYPDASRYLSAGIDFLMSDGNDYWTEQYVLALSLFHEAADTESCIKNYDRALELVEEVLEHAHSLQDQIPAIVTKINCLGERGRIKDALDVGIDALQQLGEALPVVVTKRAVQWETFRTKLALRGRSKEYILNLRPMECKNKLAATQILSVLLPYVFHGTSYYSPLIGARLVRLCLQHGLHKYCALGFVTIGWVLCVRDRKLGYHYGNLAMSIIDQTLAKELVPRVYMFFYGFIHHWRCPIRESIEPLQNVVQVGMNIGDVDYAMMALHFACTHSLHCGLPLRDVEKLYMEATQQMRLYQQENMLVFARLNLQFVHNLTGRARDPTVLEGEASPSSFDVTTQSNVPLSVKGLYCCLEANLSFRFGDYEKAHERSELRRNLAYNHFALFSFVVTRQMEALIAIAIVRGNGQQQQHGPSTAKSKKEGIKTARQVLKEMRSWTRDCAENNQFRLYMVEAELKSLKRHNQYNPTIVHLYQASVDSALQGGFTHEAALACELAAEYMLRQGEYNKANQFFKKAHRLYRTWGATEKAAHLLAAVNSMQI